MDFENTLSNAAGTDTTPETDVAPDTGTDTVTETGGDNSVIVLQSPAEAAGETVRAVSLDAPTLETEGLPAVVRSVFGDYHVRTQTVTETASDGTTVTGTEPVAGLAGLDWYWLSGVFLFTIVLWSFFRFLGVVFKR